MSTTLTYDRRMLTRVLPVMAIGAAMLLVAGLVMFSAVRNAEAAKPSDFGLTEGNTISAAGSSDPDVYIINDAGYKRLFLNPVIFNFYGHLGGFAKVKTVTPVTRDAFPTSGLFRNCETNDQKVYGVATTGEDTGMLHWVNTSGAQAVADDPKFFSKVFCINNNEFSWYAQGTVYTSVNQVPNYVRVAGTTTTPLATGPLSVSLSPANPGPQTITKNAQGVEMLKALISGSGTVQSLTFKRFGAGATADFTNTYIYDGARRLTSGKTFSSATGEVAFVNLNISVNGSKTLSFVADFTATGGDVNSISLTNATGSGAISGAPLAGNNFTVGGSNGGTMTLAKVGSLSNPSVGAMSVQISEFKLTANTEAASVKRIQMLQGGTVKVSDILNIKLKTTDGKEWTGSTTSDGYLVFDLSGSGGYTITKGGSATFKVYADLGGKKDETIQLYFEVGSDIQAVGDQFGFGMAATITAMDTSGESHSLTLQGGALTIVQAGPTARNISTTVTDVTLLNFNMTAATNIEVRKSEFTLCEDTGGEGTYNDSADTDSGWSDLTDFKVTDIDSGNVVIGPADGSAFTTSDAGTCPNAATGAQKSFSDTLDLSAGKTYHFRITADIDTSIANGTGFGIAAGDRIRVALDDYTDDTPDVTVMKYAGTNTSVADADIVPGADISGPDLTVSAASLTLGLSGAPGSQVYVKGTGLVDPIDAVGFTFTTSLASAVKITDITLTGYVDDDGNNPFAKIGSVSDANLKVGNLVNGLKLVEAESGAVIASGVSSSNLSSSTSTAVFNGLSWNIPAGTTRTLLVKTNLSNNNVSGSADYFAFDIAATTDVTGLDVSNATVNAGNTAPNTSTTPVVTVTVIASGSLTVARAPDNPGSSSMYWGENGHSVGKFRFTSNKTTSPVGNEAFFIETIRFQQGDGYTAADYKNNVSKVYMTYKDKAGNTLTASQNPDSNTSVSFGFAQNCTVSGSNTTDCRPYVPKGSSMDVAVSVDVKNNEQSTSAKSFTVMLNGGDASMFRAVGDSSGQVKDGGNIADVDGLNRVYIYRTYPRIESIALASPYDLIGTPTVFKFRVTAMGLPEARLLFDNQAVASGSIKFEVVSSGQWIQANASTSFSVYETTNGLNDLIDNNTLTQDARTSTDASLTFDFTTKDIEIGGGQSKDFRIQIDNPSANYAKTSDTGRAKDYFQVILRDNENGLIKWVDNSTFGGSALQQLGASSIRTTGMLRSGEISGPTFQR